MLDICKFEFLMANTLRRANIFHHAKLNRNQSDSTDSCTDSSLDDSKQEPSVI